MSDDLSRLFHEAVDHVEPRPGLDDIRARLTEEPAMNRRWIAPLAAAAAVAAIAGGFLLTSGGDPSGSPDLPPATSPSGTTSPSPSPSPSPSDTPDPAPSGETKAVPVYFVGDTPQGPRLFREFHRVTGAGPMEAVELAVAGTALDADYRSAWPAGADIGSVGFDGIDDDGQFSVRLPDDSLHDRPAGMTQREAELAIEQVIYTLQGAAQTRAPVQFYLNGNPVDQVLGVPTSEPLANGPVLDTLALVNLTSPAEGTVQPRMALEVAGVANSFEANVPLRLLRAGSTEVVWQGFATAEGCCEEKLFPFTTTVDVSQLPAGTYVLEATTDDPSGGEGPGPHVDTKTITLR